MHPGEPLIFDVMINDTKVTLSISAQTMLEWGIEPTPQGLQECRRRAIGAAETELAKRKAKAAEAWAVSIRGDEVIAQRL